MPENAIEVRSLVKSYASSAKAPPKLALKGVDLDIPAGSIFGLLGPNGAGKSTFINILAGLVVKSSGTVRIWGFDQDINPRQSRAAIGVVPQGIESGRVLHARPGLGCSGGSLWCAESRTSDDGDSDPCRPGGQS